MQESPAKLPQYKVSIWETAAVIISAIALFGIGLTGLALKFLSNAATPQRAEAIANTVMSYSLPNGSQGLLGLNIAGAKVALIASEGDQPDVQLLVARIRGEQDSGKRRIDRILDSIALGADAEELKINTIRNENNTLCGVSTSVTVRSGELKFPDAQTKATVIYRASVVLSNNRYIVNLLTNGQTLDVAEQKAATVFKSLQCRQ